jgi:predicted Zn-dependent protease
MKLSMRGLIGALGAATLVVACAKVPFTGRLQPNLVPTALMNSIGASTYDSLLSAEKVVTSGSDLATVKTIGQRIAKQTGASYDWAYKLVEDDGMINAWCLPGGKIAVYTGVLPVAQNEAGLAFIMGHEVGHAVANHSAERLTEQLAVLGGLGALYLLIDKKTELTTEQSALLLGALGVGAEVGIVLPFSRMHESEADVIGAMYMASAGYPPDQAMRVWERMEIAAPSGVPQFLSTHPTNETRQAALTDWMASAGKRYARNKLPEDTLSTRWGGLPSSGSKGAAAKPERDSGAVTRP